MGKALKLGHKGQLEIMGLAIIIILFVIGVIFALNSLINKEAFTLKREFTQTQLTSNFGISLLQASTLDCRDATIQELIADCAEYYHFGGFITCENGQKSCAYVNDTMTYILNETLQQWVVPYHISLELNEGTLLEWNNLGCTNTGVGKAEFFTIPTSSFTPVTLKIFICTQY
jgi:hypothetical protein